MSFLQMLSFLSNISSTVAELEASPEFADLMSRVPAFEKFYSDVKADLAGLDIHQIVADVETGIAAVKAKL